MPEGDDRPYAIFKDNFVTLPRREMVSLATSEVEAERLVETYEAKLTEDERDAGWTYYSERTYRESPMATKTTLNFRTNVSKQC